MGEKTPKEGKKGQHMLLVQDATVIGDTENSDKDTSYRTETVEIAEDTRVVRIADITLTRRETATNMGDLEEAYDNIADLQRRIHFLKKEKEKGTKRNGQPNTHTCEEEEKEKRPTRHQTEALLDPHTNGP